MPSASSSTSAPGHTRCSNPGISNGPDAKVSPGSSRSCFEARATSRSSPSAVPFRFPFTHSSPSIRTVTNAVWGSSSSAVTTHGPIDSGTPRGVGIGSPFVRRASQSPTRVYPKTTDGVSSAVIASSTARRRTAAIFGWNSSQPAPTGHGISSSGPNAGRPPSTASTERSAVGSSAASRRGRSTTKASASSRSRAARAASSTVPPLLLTSRSIVSGNAGWPSRLGRSTTFPSRSAPSRRCPRRSKVTSLKGGR